MKIFTLHEGNTPLIISIPHAGTDIPDDIKLRLTPEALCLSDTDWHVPRLYDFAQDLGATIIAAHYSRYVIDLNRPPDNATLYPGQVKMPLCPLDTFEEEFLYKAGQEPDEAEIARRLDNYWRPYHEELARQIERVKNAHGYALLYDAHSIKAEVPRLFEGRLPDLNIGTAKGASCAPVLEQAAFEGAKKSSYSAVLNGRFIGGYITRHYGDPAHHVHALQMEIARDNYMEETGFVFNEEKAKKLRPVLQSVIQSVQVAAREKYNPARITPAQGLNPKR